MAPPIRLAMTFLLTQAGRLKPALTESDLISKITQLTCRDVTIYLGGEDEALTGSHGDEIHDMARAGASGKERRRSHERDQNPGATDCSGSGCP